MVWPPWVPSFVIIIWGVSWLVGWLGRSTVSGLGILNCPTMRLNNLTVQFQG